MIHRNNFRIILLIFMGACTAPTAMLGPAYSLTSGNVVQADFHMVQVNLLQCIQEKHQLEM